MKNYNDAINIAVAGTTFGTVFECWEAEQCSYGVGEVAMNLSTVSGTTPTLAATPQISMDGVNFQDAKDLSDTAIAFASVSTADAATVARHKYMPRVAAYVRMKYVATGTGISIIGTTKIGVR